MSTVTNKDAFDMKHYGLQRSNYESEQAKLKNEDRKQKIVNSIGSLEKEPVTGLFQTMDFVEKLIGACGGETKATFIEVSSHFIKCFTRVPLQGNLFPFLPESQDNPRFHKVVTKVLLLKSCIEDVRWLPSVEGERGSYLLVTLKKEEEKK